MIMENDIVTLNKKELEEVIDIECRKRLGISTKEFMQKYNHGKLSTDSTAVHDMEMLLKVANKQ